MTAPLVRFSTSTDPVGGGPLGVIGGVLAGTAAVVLLVACLSQLRRLRSLRES